MENNKCSCPHHKSVAFLVMLFGLLFLVGSAGWLSIEVVNLLWPVIVLAGGFMMMVDKTTMCKCC